jgi:hypothetical protein
MSSGAVRDSVADHLVTPQNAALVVIDYHPRRSRPSGRWIPTFEEGT